MSDVVRTARIVINLEQGRATLDPAALAPIVELKQKELELTRQVQQAQEQAAAAATKAADDQLQAAAPVLEQKAQEAALATEAAQASAAAGEAARKAAEDQAAATAPVLDLKRQEAELTDAARQAHVEAGNAAQQAAATQTEAAVQIAKANADILGGVQAVGEGVFMLGRAMTLFSSGSNEDLAKLARSVATVQAGFDLFKGAVQTIRGVAEVLDKMAAAGRLAATAEGVRAAATAATVPPTAAAAVTTGALAAAVATIALPLTILVGLIAAVATAWKLWSDSTEEAAAEAEDTRRRMEELDASLASIHAASTQRDLERRNTLMERMTAEEQLLELQRRQAEGAGAGARAAAIQDQGLFGGGQQEALEEQRALAEAGLAAMRDEANLRREMAAERQQELADAAKLIETRQRELELAQQSLATEQSKVDAFAAQFGQLTQAQQARLQSVADRVRGGEELSRGDLGFLQRFGGEQGRAIAQNIFQQRGEAAGAGNVFAGISTGAPGVAAAQQEVYAARGRLNEATGGKPPEQALADLQAEAADVKTAYEEFLAGQRETWERAVGVMAEIDGRIEKLEQAAAQQRAFQ